MQDLGYELPRISIPRCSRIGLLDRLKTQTFGAQKVPEPLRTLALSITPELAQLPVDKDRQRLQAFKARRHRWCPSGPSGKLGGLLGACGGSCDGYCRIICRSRASSMCGARITFCSSGAP
jgi:hypothetical protein